MSGRRQHSTPVFPKGSGVMTRIGDFTLSGDGKTLQYLAIPQTFSALRVEVVGQSGRAGVDNTGLRFTHNGLATANYFFAYHGWGNAGAMQGSGSDARGYLGQTPAGNRSNDNYVGSHILEVPFYTRTDIVKEFFARGICSTGNVTIHSVSVGNVWIGDINAVSRLDIMDDVAAVLGPRAKATLYGIA
jgi:hypothetical protein